MLRISPLFRALKPISLPMRCFSSREAKQARKIKLRQATKANAPKTPRWGPWLSVVATLTIGAYAYYDIENHPEGALARLVYDNDFLASMTEPQAVQLPMPPPSAPGTLARPVLVIDLERTLIASIHDYKNGWRHVKRPGVDEFLSVLSRDYELIIFSEGDINMNFDILMAVDRFNLCHKLGPTAGELRGDQILKRIDKLNRNPARILVLDDSSISSSLCASNTLLVKPYEDIHAEDTVLYELIPVLRAIAKKMDFRQTLDDLGTHDASEVIAIIRADMEEARNAEEVLTAKGVQEDERDGKLSEL